MTNKLARPRGTSDILPDEANLWQDIEEKARKVLKVYGYKEIRTPIFEETELFKRSLGQTSDVVQKQMLELEKEGLSLRPEGTASVVRSYLENGLDKNQGLAKFFYFGPMFRGERPQKGRLRQFHQIGAEVIGPISAFPFFDAEVIVLSVHLLEALGLRNLKLKINNLGTPAEKEKLSDILREQLKDQVKDLCSDCQERFGRNVFRILDCKNEQCRQVVEKIKIDDSHLDQRSRDYFSEVKNWLSKLQIPFEVAPYLVRGLDYYVGPVFEISYEGEGLGSQNALGAGGRYNSLLQDLGGHDGLGGLGFALGIERIILAMGDGEKKSLDTPLDVFLVYKSINAGDLRDSVYHKVFELLNVIRRNGVSADMLYIPTDFPKQMGVAGKRARFAVIVGENEFKENTVMLKDLKSATQEKIPANQMIETLKKRLC